MPWLSPCAASLLALARAPCHAVWAAVRRDPGAVLLLLGPGAARAASGLSCFPALVRDPVVIDAALRQLGPPLVGFVDWSRPALRPVYQAALAYARLAAHLAHQTGRADPENAWVAGLLAPLGWLAAAAADPDLTAACLADPSFEHEPARVQQRRWGLDQAGIGRRLALRWRLPRWLAVIPGFLGLPVETAQALGADPDLFLTVQLAVRLVQDHQEEMKTGHGGSTPGANEAAGSLRLEVGATAAVAAAALDVSPAELDKTVSWWKERGCGEDPAPAVWEAPDQVPLLPDLLRLAAENRHLANAVVRERLEEDVDTLHQALAAQIAGEARRLHAQKLSALAEFAAGAGHEINNPLAVISGQAQYLLGHEPEPARQKALQTIIGQTKRIHQLLADLMQFARPPRPQTQPVEVATLVREVTAALQDLAGQRQVRLLSPEVIPPCTVHGDRHQVATALTSLLRNAVEAAPAEGWAGVRLETADPDRLELVVEDSGAGPTALQREHLFDPFFSGRTAGRGRGLGLAIAWRLAREQGGDVRFDSPPGGPTRFVLSLPRHGGNGSLKLTG